MVLMLYRKAPDEVSKILSDTVSEQWKEHVPAMIKPLEQLEQPLGKRDHDKGRGCSIPVNQPTIKSFWQTTAATRLQRINEEPIRLSMSTG